MYSWLFWAAWIVLVPAIVAIIKFKQIPDEFRPLVYAIWLAALTEAASMLAASVLHNNMHIYNVYMLADFFMTVWLFYKWGALKSTRKWVLGISAAFFIGIWLFDNLLLNRIDAENIIFRMIYSITLVLMGVNQLSRIYIHNNGYLLRNSYLYITFGIIFYYTYSAFISLINSSSLFGPSTALWQHTMLIYVTVNVITNMLYTISLLWMQRKAKSM